MTRTILSVSGADRDRFLHGLLTAEVPRTGLGYAALLTPQGKYLADFLTLRRDGDVLLDVAEPLAADLARRLGMYRLRSDVRIEAIDLPVRRGTGPAPAGALADPRPGMGWRLYGEAGDDGTDWDALRVEHMVPEIGLELIPGETFVLEMGFERLGGIDFRKGCYVGQEIVARMHHKTTLRKGLARVAGAGLAPGQKLQDAQGREAGTVHTVSGGRALAYLRFDRAEGGMTGPGGPVALDARAV
jgi:folate-binding protein YgfZ